MENKIVLSSRVKTFVIENEEGRKLTELRLDPTNDSTLSRFMDLYDNANRIGDETKKKIEALDTNEKELSIETAHQILEINNESVNALIEETDNMFGAGFTREIFAEHYEADENFVPNVSLFVEFYTKIMPVIQNVYKDSQKNYSIKKGK